MNTSGSYDTLTLSRDQVILDALQEIQVVDASITAATLGAQDIAKGATKLGMMLQEWRIAGLYLWCRDTLQIPTVANKSKYTIGQSGADFTSYRPLRALLGSFSRQTVGTVAFDTPLTLMSRIEYMQLGNKSVGGTPNSFYYDPQMGSGVYNPTNGLGVLYLFSQPTDNSRTIFLEVGRPLQDVTSSAQTFDVPLEWYNALSLGLAAKLCNSYQVPSALRREVKAEAADAFTRLSDWGAQEQAPFTFQPDMQMGVQQR